MKKLFSLFFVTMILLAFYAVGCKNTMSPASTKKTSNDFSSLSQRIAFLEKYVRFRRSYQMLIFDIDYKNNSGLLLSAPHDWDIRLIAKVPSKTLAAWTRGLPSVPPQKLSWITKHPFNMKETSFTKWYKQGGKVVAIDTQKNLVLYWNRTR